MSKCHYCHDRRRPTEVNILSIRINKNQLGKLRQHLHDGEQGDFSHTGKCKDQGEIKCSPTLKITPLKGNSNEFVLKLVRGKEATITHG